MTKKLSVSSLPEKRVRKRQEDIVFTEKMRAELEALKYIEPDLTDPENPETTDFSGFVRGKFYRPRKEQVTIRFDADVLDWFRHADMKYQTLINLVCREYMMRQIKKKVGRK